MFLFASFPQIICSLYPYVTISQAASGEITIKTETTFKNKEEKFMLGVPYKVHLVITRPVGLLPTYPG